MTDACPNCGKRHRLLTGDECADRQMSETTLRDRVKYRAKKHGWKIATAGKGLMVREDGSTIVVTPMSPGWPDLTLARAGSRLLFMELKKELGVVEPEQIEWLALLNSCGARAILVRPSDLREGRVAAILKDGSPIG